MSFEDYIFEDDPLECMDTLGSVADDYTKVYRHRAITKRECTNCKLVFKSQYPCACTRCGSWTNSL